eukprot:1029009-Rhodomonas_salina.2
MGRQLRYRTSRSRLVGPFGSVPELESGLLLRYRPGAVNRCDSSPGSSSSSSSSQYRRWRSERVGP